MRKSYPTAVLSILGLMVFCGGCSADGTAPAIDTALTSRIAAAEARLKAPPAGISKAMVDSASSNLYMVRKLERGEKLNSFDDGMASATASQYSDRKECATKLSGLLCEVEEQLAMTKAAGAPAACAKDSKSSACLEAKMEAELNKLKNMASPPKH